MATAREIKNMFLANIRAAGESGITVPDLVRAHNMSVSRVLHFIKSLRRKREAVYSTAKRRSVSGKDRHVIVIPCLPNGMTEWKGDEQADDPGI